MNFYKILFTLIIIKNDFTFSSIISRIQQILPNYSLNFSTTNLTNKNKNNISGKKILHTHFDNKFMSLNSSDVSDFPQGFSDIEVGNTNDLKINEKLARNEENLKENSNEFINVTGRQRNFTSVEGNSVSNESLRELLLETIRYCLKCLHDLALSQNLSDSVNSLEEENFLMEQFLGKKYLEEENI